MTKTNCHTCGKIITVPFSQDVIDSIDTFYCFSCGIDFENRANRLKEILEKTPMKDRKKFVNSMIQWLNLK